MQTFSLHATQDKLLESCASPARHILGYGGSRSGKTFGFCYAVGTRAIMAPESRHLICRLHNVDVRQSVMMDTWPAMMKKAYPHVDYEMKKSDQYAVFANGAEVWFAGLDDKDRIDKILGKEYVTIYANEASQIAYETILTLRTRLAQKCFKSDGRQLPLKFYADLNPTGRSHWTYKEFVEGIRPDNGMALPEGSRAYVVLNPADNPNLPPEYLEELQQLPEKQRKRFFEGQYLSEVPNALWPTERIDRCRIDVAEVPIKRVVIGVDPSGSDGIGGDSQGIIVGGLGEDGDCYIFEDATVRLSPAGWGMKVAQLYKAYGADCVVAEQNYGGAMVASTLLTADPTMKVKMVTASRGKHIRAEPIAGLYEDTPVRPHRVHHVGRFPQLEEQMAMFTTDGYQGAGSPDRLDALVWVVTELMLGPRVGKPKLTKIRL